MSAQDAARRQAQDGADQPRGGALALAPGVPEVRAVSRAIALLRGFDPARAFMGLGELALATGIDKGTARRLLQTLRREGLVEHDPARGYALTFGLLELSANIHRGGDLLRRARPMLEALAEEVGGLAFLWVADGEACVCLDRARSGRSAVTALISPGDRCSLNCGAGPRALLAFMDEEQRERALRAPMQRRTPATEIDPDRLRALCAGLRLRGHEFVADDFITGLAAAGAPVIDAEGSLVGAISITNLTSALTLPDGQPKGLESLLAAARKLGRG